MIIQCTDILLHPYVSWFGKHRLPLSSTNLHTAGSVMYSTGSRLFPLHTSSLEFSYLLENDDSLLIMAVGGDVKHGSPVTGDDVVVNFGIFPDVQIMRLDSAHSRADRGRLGNS